MRSSPERTDSAPSGPAAPSPEAAARVASSFSRISRWRSFALARSEADSLGKPDWSWRPTALHRIAAPDYVDLARDQVALLAVVSRLSLVYSGRRPIDALVDFRDLGVGGRGSTPITIHPSAHGRCMS